MAVRSSARWGFVLAVVSAAAFGTSGVLARSLIGAGWSAEAAVTARIGVAAVVMIGPVLLALRGRWAAVRRSRGTLILFGLISVAGTQAAYFNAVQHLQVGVALLLEYSGILLVVVWMWLRHGQRPGPLTATGAVAAVAGLVLVLNLTTGAGLDPAGLIWGALAAAGLATYFVLSARIDPELPSIALAGGGMVIGAAALAVLGLIGVLPMRATTAAVTLGGHQVSWLVPVLGVALVSTVFAYSTGIGAARVLGAAMASFAGLAEVLFAVVFAWLALGELPTPVQALGGVFIIAGIVLVRLDEARRPAGSHHVGDSPLDRLAEEPGDLEAGQRR